MSESVNQFLRAAVTDALNPGLELLSASLLATPSVEQIPRVAQLWDSSWQIVLSCYAILVLAAGVLVMGRESVQTRYGLRELLPRLVFGFLAGALSLAGAGTAIEVANALSRSLLADGVDPTDGAGALRELVLSAVAAPGSQGAMGLLLLGAVVAVMLLALLLVYVVRVAATIILVVGAPLALMLHALPQTEGVARWWWRAFAGCLAIQVAQSLTLVVALRVFLTPGGLSTGLFGTAVTTSGWVTMLVSLALLYILWKIPFWILSSVGFGGSGRSLLGSALRTVVLIKTGGLLGGGTRGLAGLVAAGGRRGARPPAVSAPGDAGGGDDPYARTRATAGGQLFLPLGLSRGPRRTAPRPKSRPDRATSTGRGGAGGRQLALPLQDGLWPEHRPVLGGDGQYRLPLDVSRQKPEPPSPPQAPAGGPVPSAGASRPPRARQLALPLEDPQRHVWSGNRPLASGQYPLPLGVRRQPRPTPPAAPQPPASGPPARGRREGRQLELALDPYRGNRPLRGGQYPLPLDGLTRHPRPPTPPAPAPPAPGPPSTPGRQLRLPNTAPPSASTRQPPETPRRRTRSAQPPPSANPARRAPRQRPTRSPERDT